MNVYYNFNMNNFILKYFNPMLKIAVGKWNQAYLIGEDIANAIELIPEYYKGCLVYRIPKTSKRFSYKTVKANLIVKKNKVLINNYKFPF